VIGDASSLYSLKGASTSPTQLAAAVMAARRMHARLPSISGEFRQSVPLTRIRDIAHRGDIPRDVKEEIKHTLQNKLHRSAGNADSCRHVPGISLQALIEILI
jgi:phosphoglucan,water dikinase